MNEENKSTQQMLAISSDGLPAVAGEVISTGLVKGIEEVSACRKDLNPWCKNKKYLILLHLLLAIPGLFLAVNLANSRRFFLFWDGGGFVLTEASQGVIVAIVFALLVAISCYSIRSFRGEIDLVTALVPLVAEIAVPYSLVLTPYLFLREPIWVCLAAIVLMVFIIKECVNHRAKSHDQGSTTLCELLLFYSLAMFSAIIYLCFFASTSVCMSLDETINEMGNSVQLDQEFLSSVVLDKAWYSLDIDQKLYFLSALAAEESDYLGIEAPSSVRASDLDGNTIAVTYLQDGEMVIDYDVAYLMGKKSVVAINATLYEMAHLFQREVVANPSILDKSGWDIALSSEDIETIRSELLYYKNPDANGIEEYSSQFIESMANKYASQNRRRILEPILNDPEIFIAAAQAKGVQVP